jgi:deoxycytidylate deaminase
MEYGMFVAKAAALRTLDLSLQVGAAIFSKEGEIVSMGSNEVPKAGGGTYWCDDPYDDREFVRGVDSNDRRKNEILSELLEAVERADKIRDKKVADSQFMYALEYGRIIHAEMSAIVDAARLGRRTKDTYLFCTTFPCHMCAKHIVGAGIQNVYFLEPYPKSLVSDLHNDSVSVEGNDRGRYSQHPSVVFEHCFGVSPRRYRELFERGARKSDGKFSEWARDEAVPNLYITSPIYAGFEEHIVREIIPKYIMKAKFDTCILDG